MHVYIIYGYTYTVYVYICIYTRYIYGVYICVYIYYVCKKRGQGSSTPRPLIMWLLCAGFWVFLQEEEAALWRDLCPLTSSTPTTTACSRWSSTWVCRWGSTGQSSTLFLTFLFPLVRLPSLKPQALLPSFCSCPPGSMIVTCYCLSDETLQYRLIGWLASPAS